MLESAKEKILRALRLKSEAERMLEEFAWSNPVSIVGGSRYPVETPGALSITKPLPTELLLAVGDCVHNLRSALDHCIFEVLTKDGTKLSENQIQFPIAEKGKDQFQAAINRLAPEQDVKDLLERIEAYPEGFCQALVGLHKLDIVDKHRSIPTFVSSVTVRGLRQEWSNPDGDFSSELDPVTVHVTQRGVGDAPNYGPGVYGLTLFGSFSPLPLGRRLNSNGASFQFEVKLAGETYVPDADLRGVLHRYADRVQWVIWAVDDLLTRRN